jgi:hypothetical protein
MTYMYLICSFLYDSLIELVGAAMGLIGAYLIYRLTITQMRRDRLKYVALLVEKIIPSVIDQAQYCSQHAARLKEFPFKDNLLSLEPNRDTKRLADKVDQEGVYHAYLWKYGRTDEAYKSFHELYRHIDYIDALIDDLIQTNERILTSTWNRKKEYALIFTKSKELIQTFSVTPGFEKENSEFLTVAGAALEEFSNKHQESENVEASFNVVIKPVQDYIIQKAKIHPKITELMLLTQDARNKFHGIELSAKHNAEEYSGYASKLESAANNLKQASTSIRLDFGKPRVAPY